MAQDLGFPWSSSSSNNGMGYPIDNFMTHELQRLSRIKDEFSVSESYPKFLDMLNCSPTSSIEDLQLHPSSSYVKNDHHQQISYSNNNQDFLLTTLSSTGCQIKGGQLINDQNCSNGIFSQNFPTISISSLNQSSSSSSSSSSGISSSSFDMNSLPALDLFGSPRFDGSFTHPSSLNGHTNLGCLSYGLNSMHQPSHRPSVCPSKISSISTAGSTGQPAKRPASKFINAKATQSVSVKKSKLEPRPSSAPFQVRKEKLGDRIAAIQQLVAPFGKTDTASVLMEAIGYIKFLQTQVETLSVPYMKSTDKTSGIPTRRGHLGEGNKETKRDLRSRGLCLVPLSCLSYITGGGEGIWPGS
ncbi:transcription factor bHLH110-like [Cynara cardunculus var. scolymus]|uniref:transcription factor bHLH110-like n=1 Tax=Cynara cardunculus var. scolymus TaxID=59895 RepID=UPI000D62F3BD|nr:transcription factor bHLH110-like [Cynara cardunculus var. scolymus]